MAAGLRKFGTTTRRTSPRVDGPEYHWKLLIVLSQRKVALKGTSLVPVVWRLPRSYGISVTTLEEVFLKVASGDAVPRCVAPLRCSQHSFQWSNIWRSKHQNQSNIFENSMEAGLGVLQCPQRPHHVLTWSTLSYELAWVFDRFWASGKWPWLWFFKSIVILVLKYRWWMVISNTNAFPRFLDFRRKYFTTTSQVVVIRSTWSKVYWAGRDGSRNSECLGLRNLRDA